MELNEGGTPPPPASADDLLGGTPTPPPTGEQGTGGQGAGQGTGEQGTGEQGTGEQGEAAHQAFLAQFSAESDGDDPALRDWVQATGVKDLNQLAKRARDNQKALRESGRIKLPGEGASPEEVAAFRKAIGVPDDPAGYQMPVVKDQNGEPVELNSTELAAIAKIAHANGIPASSLEPTLQAIAEQQAQQLATIEADLTAKAKAHADKWGADRDNNLAALNRAFEALELQRDEVLALRAALGPERAMDVFARLGRGIGEDTMIAGERKRTFGLSGAEAQKAINDKRADPQWVQRAMQPGTPESAEYNRLLAVVGAAADRQMQDAG